MNRKYLLLIALALLFVSVKAQDTIIFMNGDELIARVREVSDSELKYQLWNNQDGPLYIKKTAEIFMVKYRNGHKEIFSNKTWQKQSTVSSIDYGKMEASRGDLIIDGQRLHDEDILEIFGDAAMESYLSACSQRRKGHLLISLGWVEIGGGIILLLLAESLYDYSDYYTTHYTGLSALSLGLAEILVGYVLLGKGNRRISNMAYKYNAAHGYSDNFSVKIAPTIMYASTETGGLNCGFGAGLSFKF